MGVQVVRPRNDMRATTEPKSHIQKRQNRSSNQAYVRLAHTSDVRLAHTSDRPVEVGYDGGHLQSQVLGKLSQEDDKNKNIKRNFRWLSDRTRTYSPGLTQDHIHALNRH